MSERIRNLSHTADVGFRVDASTLEGLFAAAAWALVEALTDGEFTPEPDGGGARSDGGSRGTHREELRISRPDRERLLVAWLREILHRALSEGRIPADIDVRFEDPGTLSAAVHWSRPGQCPEVIREIKGVTYHGLAVRETEDGWSASVVLDV
jgi:SHS2 domain-containing protein